MFRIVSIIGFIIVFGGIAVHCIARPCSKERRWGPIGILKKLVHLFTLLFLEQKLSPLGVLRKLVYLLALLCFVVLAVNGFYAVLVLEKSISGYWIMLQTTAGGVFAVCLAVLAVMWAQKCRLNQSDCPLLQRVLQRVIRLKTASEPLCKSSRLGQKIAFWLIIFLALPLILSIVLSMFPFFGTHWQEFLISTHRWTALVFAVVVIVHTYLLIRTKMQE